jgi:hypothetical protein
MNPTREHEHHRSAQSGPRRFLEHWAQHFVYPGEFSVLTQRAAVFGACGRSGADNHPATDPQPLAQGFALRADHDVFAVGRGVGAALDAGEGEVRAGLFALAIGLHEVGLALGREPEEVEREIDAAAKSVASRMREAAMADARFESAGCAVTALWLSPPRPVLLHAGDCLAIRLRSGSAQALTVEHTLERDSHDKGMAVPSPYIRSVLLRMLGAFEGPRGEPDVVVPDLAPEDRVLLLSTDVATRLVHGDFATAFEGTPAEAGRRLLDLALARKAPEAAVVVVDLS